MIFYEQPTARWEPFDFKLLEAYQMLQDEICGQCGHPVWLCRSDSGDVEFKVGSQICYAEKALREAEFNKTPRADRPKGKELKEEKASWGLSHYTLPKVPEGVDTELPTRREYFEGLVEKA